MAGRRLSKPLNADMQWHSTNVTVRGVRATDAAVDASRHMITIGAIILEVVIEATPTPKDDNNDNAAWANGAAANKRGKTIPPGNPAPAARAIDTNFANPTWIAATGPENGTDGLTIADLVKNAAKPCFVAAKGVC